MENITQIIKANIEKKNNKGIKLKSILTKLSDNKSIYESVNFKKLYKEMELINNNDLVLMHRKHNNKKRAK